MKVIFLVETLPEPVKRYFLHSIAIGTPLATSAKYSMSGDFLAQQDEKSWLPMQAKEIISTVGFVWKATIGRGLLRLEGADYYVMGVGKVEFSLWGVPK
ncbi:hypothetical protein F7734_05140 [Scytonema sp. UIC 10036]|uniref:DUF6920 family protein n=1 Tax=Scytonema sp. UIC 10036 TaxID=2304196 RepID=UPI0012DA1F6B|nr:DUF6544 family protein [Scytonema sp. UIC 10036]MUG91888.1 hypothetical protein [Scytonema sp. UIC 10036]